MASTGEFLIFASLLSIVASAGVYVFVWRGMETLRSLARNLYYLSATLIVSAISILLYLILTHDFSVAYVYQYSSTDLPLDYLISTLWGGQEGTFLLWVFFTSILGLIMMRTAGKFEAGNMFFLNLFILSVILILIKKSPFELLDGVPIEGNGLNPLLQNYWMVIHPPIMFWGFSGVVIPFCFAMTALVEKKYMLWAEAARRWTLFAWVALGVSLIMGGYWAYETLGWGGFWAWDPVENSSLIPWLFLTTQVHALFIKRKRGGLMRFSLISACLTFWSVLYGTFLTRSGVLADFSVHSFVDLGINQFLIGGLFFFLTLGISLLVSRWKQIPKNESYSKVGSRSYLVSLGVVVLFLGGLLVLLGTSAPLLTRINENPSNVGLPYYFATMTPIAVAVLLLLGLFPSYRWNEGVSRWSLMITGASGALITIIALIVTGVTTDIAYLLLFGFAVWALISNGYAFGSGLLERKFKPAYIAHIGLAVCLTGATTSAGFSSSYVATLTLDRPVYAMGYDVNFTDIVPTEKGFDCHVEFSSEDDKFVAVLPHEFPKNSEGVMKRPYVENYLDHDFYIAPNSFRPAETTDPGELMLIKGESKQVGKYKIEFVDYDFTGHDETELSVAANLLISWDGKTEKLAPSLSSVGVNITPIPVSFDEGLTTIEVAGVLPETGGVVLQVTGDQVPPAASIPAVLVVELSRKPWIILFWLGTFLMFLGGGLSMVKKKKKVASTGTTNVQGEPAATSTGSSSPTTATAYFSK